MESIVVNRTVSVEKFEWRREGFTRTVTRLLPDSYVVEDWGGIEEGGTLFNLVEVGVVIIPDGMWQPLEILN